MNENKLLKLEKETVYNEGQKKTVKDFSHLNTLAKKGQIVLAGDSIVEIWPVTELLYDLRKQTGLEIYNRGISGDTTNRFLERIESTVCSLEPGILYVIIGTNDVGMKFPAEYTLENIKKMIASVKLHCPECRIFIQSLFPVNRNLDKSMVGARKNKKIIALNDELKRLVLNSGCSYIDVFEDFLDELDDFDERFTYDGLHPSINGYVRLGEIITPIIAAKAPSPGSPAPLKLEEIITTE